MATLFSMTLLASALVANAIHLNLPDSIAVVRTRIISVWPCNSRLYRATRSPLTLAAKASSTSPSSTRTTSAASPCPSFSSCVLPRASAHSLHSKEWTKVDAANFHWTADIDAGKQVVFLVEENDSEAEQWSKSVSIPVVCAKAAQPPPLRVSLMHDLRC